MEVFHFLTLNLYCYPCQQYKIILKNDFRIIYRIFYLIFKNVGFIHHYFSNYFSFLCSFSSSSTQYTICDIISWNITRIILIILLIFIFLYLHHKARNISINVVSAIKHNVYFNNFIILLHSSKYVHSCIRFRFLFFV